MVQQYQTDETVTVPSGTTDRVLDQMPRSTGTESRYVAPAVRTEVREVRNPRDLVRWGPILAGTAVGLGLTLILSVLGLAIGSSAFEPGTDVTDWTTGAGIWGLLTVLVAFFATGWVAGRSAMVDDSSSSMLTSFVAGAVLLLTLIWLTTSGVTNLVGFLASNFSGIAGFTADPTSGEVEGAFDTVSSGAWATFIIMVAAMVVAAVGGLVGHKDPDEVGTAN